MFYGHLMRMDDERLTKNIFKHSNETQKANTWIRMVKEDMMSGNIDQDSIWDRDKFRASVRKVKFPEVVKAPSNRQWSGKHQAEVLGRTEEEVQEINC